MSGNPNSMPYLDPHEPVGRRVSDLLRRMRLEDKIAQMGYGRCTEVAWRGRFSAKAARRFFKGAGIGAMQDPRMAPGKGAALVSAIQEFLVKHTRLGIPALIGSECLHGHMSVGATVFPQAIGLASTWNTKLIEKMAAVAAREARAVGVSQAFSPDLDLARDPRWGRVEETYGEDPHLAARMGVAYVKGLQGPGRNVDDEHVVATLKHYAAHGSPEGGLNIGPVAVGEREMREVFLPPFEAAVREAGALSVMPAYSEYDGVPCSASEFLLRKILREEWGFRGYTFSDYGAIEMLVTTHRTAADLSEAGRQALEAGLDLEAPAQTAYGERLLKLVRRGKVSEDLLDAAVANILRVKFLAGLFEKPFTDPRRAAKIVNNPTHRKLARRVARESIILLKNERDILPLATNLAAIAVIGPNSDKVQLGDYCMPRSDMASPLDGIRKAVSRRTKIHHARGCGLYQPSRDGFADAVSAAQQSEIAVVFVGEASTKLRGIGWKIEGVDASAVLCGEGFDRSSLGLAGVQQELIEAVVATGTPTVVVLVNGRPHAIAWVAENVPAVLEAWYAGEQGGEALADIIFGKTNPSGRLPVSIPRSVGHIPCYYNHKPSARGYYGRPGKPGQPGRDYVFSSPTPLFKFGHGLSYTSFRYSNLRVSPARIRPAGRVLVKVDVRNAGARRGKEVVQLYVNDVVSTTTTPGKGLKAFAKIDLKPAQKRTAEFTLTSDQLSLVDKHMRRVVEPGVFEVRIANLKKRFRVL